MSHIALSSIARNLAYSPLIHLLESKPLSAVLTEIFGTEILSLTEYAEKYAEGMTVQGISYAMDKDLIDYIQLGGVGNRNRYVIMTDKTQTYTPNKHPARGNKDKTAAPEPTESDKPAKPSKGGKKEVMST